MDGTGSNGRICVFSDYPQADQRYGFSLWSMFMLLKHPDDIGGIHSVGSPIHVYPLYENGFRAHMKQSVKENHDESAEMYAQFSQVAAQHKYAWNYGKPANTKETIGTVSPKNRMICFPCKCSPLHDRQSLT